MEITIEYNGSVTPRTDYNGAIGLGYPASVAGAALKASATAKVEAYVEGVRAKVTNTKSGKLAEYLIKQRIANEVALAGSEAQAVSAGTVSQAEIDMLDREAVARGMTMTELLALISDRASAFALAALRVGVIEAEGKASIGAIDDAAPTIEGDVQVIMNTVVTEVASAWAEIETILGA